jgi:uncharacterized protein (TIGR03437 family)
MSKSCAAVVFFALASACLGQQLTVQTMIATNITSTGATLNGYYAPAAATQSCQFNVEAGGGVSKAVPATSLTPVASSNLAVFSAQIIGLNPGQSVGYYAACGGNTAPQSAAFITPAMIAPEFSVNSILAAAAPARSGISPGELVTIGGQYLATTTATASAAANLPSSLAGTSVTFAGMPGAILSAAPGTITVQAPFTLSPGSYAPVVVAVDYGNGQILSSTVMVTVQSSNIGVFGYTDISGITDLSQPNQVLHPTSCGWCMTVWSTGNGPVTGWSSTGYPAPVNPLASSTIPPTATVVTGNGALSAQVLWSVLAPGQVGVWQTNIKLPPGIPTGTPVFVQLSLPDGDSVSVSITIATQ